MNDSMIKTKPNEDKSLGFVRYMLTFSVILRRNAEIFFVEAGKVVDIGKTKRFRDFADVQFGVCHEIFRFAGDDLRMKSVRRHTDLLFEKVREARRRHAA